MKYSNYITQVKDIKDRIFISQQKDETSQLTDSNMIFIQLMNDLNAKQILNGYNHLFC